MGKSKCRGMHKLLSGGGWNSEVKKWAQYYWLTDLIHESRLWGINLITVKLTKIRKEVDPEFLSCLYCGPCMQMLSFR